ncbi:hypothetical protein [Actinopolymorpha alba]|uniref:hypothetical protein n=1 Tax=Actinopolymorpha alba TaxID=533267 RepID=UPI0003829781|nr:hypothetical protein [Actinopolymorpha alba]
MRRREVVGAGSDAAVLGSRVGEVAVLETDTTYMMIDPTWALYDERYGNIARRIAARIAAEFVREGFDWVAVESNWMRSFHGAWSALVENSDLDVDGTVTAIYETVKAGKGLIVRPPC